MFGLFADINTGIEEYKNTTDAILVDVREKDEYESGHIPGAVNVPLSAIQEASLPESAVLFVYCLRGSRSKKAVRKLKEMGYGHAMSIGGIKSYRGDLEKKERT